MIIRNIIKVFNSTIWIVWIITGIAIIAIPSYYFMEKDLVIGNLWYWFYVWEMILSVTISILFWLFIWTTLYKIKYFSLKKWSIGIFGWFLGVLVAGCPACSITLASYIWLASIISVFPFYGIELKFLSVFFLIYAIYIWLRDLEVCKIKK